MPTPSVSMPDEMKQAIDDQRHASTSRAQWIREAIRVRMLLEERDGFDELLDDAPEYAASRAREEQPAE